MMADGIILSAVGLKSTYQKVYIMNIKKNFVEIYNLLNANQDSKVEDIMDDLLELMVAQQRDKNHRQTEAGLEVFCYYHKEWELVKNVEYGSKVNTATGLNSMCKVGVNQWTKQQRDCKEAQAGLLEKVMSGEIEVADLQEHKDALEEKRLEILPLIEFHEVEAHKVNDELVAKQEELLEAAHAEALAMNEE